MGNLTIADIRKLAELNLTPECYKVYLQIIEPNVKSLIPNYLKDWQNIESYVNMTVMRHMGIFKTNISFLTIDDDAEAKYGKKLDVVKFRKIKQKSFKWKIDYLHSEGILGDKSHELLDILRKKRNKIHDMGSIFSENDLQEFSMAYSITFYICTSEAAGNIGNEERTRIRNSVERTSKELLEIIKRNRK